MKRRTASILGFLDSFLAYIMTIVGVVFSAYLLPFESGNLGDVKISISSLAVSAVIALMVVGSQEYVPSDNEVARAGKRKNVFRRMGNAVANGMMWSQLITVASHVGNSIKI
jgi:hypothetical protein